MWMVYFIKLIIKSIYNWFTKRKPIILFLIILVINWFLCLFFIPYVIVGALLAFMLTLFLIAIFGECYWDIYNFIDNITEALEKYYHEAKEKEKKYIDKNK